MSTIAQISANRANALSSTGPQSAAGKARVARNAVTLGLFTMHDYVLPEESAQHDHFCATFWKDLRPAGPVEETFATEMIRAAWRLRRCGILEALLAESPECYEDQLRAQTAVDRARAQANNLFRRAHNDLRRLQSERPAPREDVEIPSEPALTNQSQPVPRSAACPCGSGEKYKRCCGRTALA